MDIPYLVQNFLLTLLAYMESAARHLTLSRLEREMLDERYIVYLYIIDLCTELDGLDSIASDDGTYIMTVNIDDTVTDFSPFKHFLFLYKNLPDDGKMFMIILGISE